MNRRVVKLDTLTHQAVQELLPWFAMDSLDADEAALVRSHLRTCTQCQADAQQQHKLRAALAHTGATLDAGRAFARLRPRLDVPQHMPPARRSLLAFLRANLATGAPWMRWAMLGQTAIIVVLALLLAPPRGDALYHGLGAPGHASGNVVVMFRPDATEQQLRQILQESGARLVDGPTAAQAYVLKVPDAQRALRLLRSKAAVVLAEPLDSGGGN